MDRLAWSDGTKAIKSERLPNNALPNNAMPNNALPNNALPNNALPNNEQSTDLPLNNILHSKSQTYNRPNTPKQRNTDFPSEYYNAMPYSDQSEVFKDVGYREEAYNKIGNRSLVKNTMQNPYICTSNYISHLNNQEAYLRPKNNYQSSIFK